MLHVENLHATVADMPILKGLTLAVNAAEAPAVMGPNGARKPFLEGIAAGTREVDSIIRLNRASAP